MLFNGKKLIQHMPRFQMGTRALTPVYTAPNACMCWCIKAFYSTDAQVHGVSSWTVTWTSVTFCDTLTRQRCKSGTASFVPETDALNKRHSIDSR